ncbi:MAG: winged helix DNA-binding domain-containing protein [Solirubrobacteraceae bacterium]
MSDAITRRELGRATLARQLLLERGSIDVGAAVERLAGMQAQEPRPPFIGLWSRIDGFEPVQLADAIRSGAVVRGPLWRGTLHAVSAADWSSFRGAAQPAMRAAQRMIAPRVGDTDLDRLERLVRQLFGKGALSASELRSALGDAYPDADARALAYIVRMTLPLVMVPTDDRWGFPRDPRLRIAEPGDGDGPEGLVRRYLAAFGPATVADAQEWSGVGGLGATFEGLRGELVVLADARGRELFDLPDAPRPAGDVPAPVRFLPEFDSLLLAHADRTRIIADEHRPRLTTKNLRVNAIAIAYGEACATWSLASRGRSSTLTIAPFGRLSAALRRELEREGEGLVRTIEPDATSVAIAWA